MLDFGDFTVPKLVIHNKTINKTFTKKHLENPKHCFWDDYIRKLPREISARRGKTVEGSNFWSKQHLSFFKTNSFSEGVKTSFNSLHDSY